VPCRALPRRAKLSPWQTLCTLTRTPAAKDASPAYPLAQLCALLHRKPDGITYLADSYAKRETQMLSSPEDPSLSSLQGEPAFEEMIKKIKHFR
jgi:hypothetical protein